VDNRRKRKVKSSLPFTLPVIDRSFLADPQVALITYKELIMPQPASAPFGPSAMQLAGMIASRLLALSDSYFTDNDCKIPVSKPYL
jgi:hypothetical protein